MGKKTLCPVSRAQFREKAQPVRIVINGTTYDVPAKEFSTGSLGWYLNEKIRIEIDGVQVTAQIGMNLTIVGSKELPADPTPSPTDPATDAE